MTHVSLKQQLLKTFLDVIQIDEIYGEEKKIVAYVINRLDKLNIPYKIDTFGNVIAYIKGEGQSILLNTHLDIPENVPNLAYEVDGTIVRSVGKSILGADPKSGLTVLLEFIEYVIKNNIATCPIELVFTRGEEAGLIGAINLDYSKLKSKIGLVLDEDGPFTNVVTKAPGLLKIDVALHGKTVHPRDWKEGKNVLPALGEILTKIKQGEIVKNVTCNIGRVTAGTARNSIAGIAQLQAELRSFDMQRLSVAGKKFTNSITRIGKKHDLDVKIESGIEFHSYEMDKSSLLMKRLEKVYKSLKAKPTYYKTFGGSDAAIFNANGITTVPIGSAYYLAHQYHEYVDFNDMEHLLHFLVAFITNE